MPTPLATNLNCFVIPFNAFTLGTDHILRRILPYSWLRFRVQNCGFSTFLLPITIWSVNCTHEARAPFRVWLRIVHCRISPRFYRTRGRYPGHHASFDRGLVVVSFRSFPQFDDVLRCQQRTILFLNHDTEATSVSPFGGTSPRTFTAGLDYE